MPSQGSQQHESSVSRGFGGGFGCVLGVLAAIAVLMVAGVGGCALMVGGCALGTGTVIDTANDARDAAARVKRERDADTASARSAADLAKPDAGVGGPTLDARTWTDITGDYTVDAALLRVEGGTAVLAKADGSTTRVPLSRLSESDRAWIDAHTPACDAAALLAMTIDEARRVLGTPSDAHPEPSELQREVVDEWDNTFTVSGHEVVVSYDLESRHVRRVFLAGDDIDTLMRVGGLVHDAPTYAIKPQSGLADPSQITGLHVVPLR